MTKKQIKRFRYWFPLLTYLGVMMYCFVAQVSWALPPVATTAQQLGAVDWDAEGEIVFEGTILAIVYVYEKDSEIGFIYINKDGFQRSVWVDSYTKDDDTDSFYYPYGPFRYGERFRIIKLANGKYRFENLTAKTSGAHSTEDSAPDRSKQ